MVDASAPSISEGNDRRSCCGGGCCGGGTLATAAAPPIIPIGNAGSRGADLEREIVLVLAVKALVEDEDGGPKIDDDSARALDRATTGEREWWRRSFFLLFSFVILWGF